MPVQVTWLDDSRRVVLLNFSAEWTAAELLDAVDAESLWGGLYRRDLLKDSLGL